VKFKAFGRSVSSTGRSLVASSVAIIAPAIAAAKLFASMGDEIGKMAKRTGIAVEDLSQLKFAVEQSGSSIATFQKGILTMAKSLNDAERGLTTKTEALAALGIEYRDLAGLAPEDQFKTIAEAISKVESPTTRAAAAMEIFGRAGKELIPLLNGGRRAIEDLQAEAEALGLTMSTEDAAAAEEFTDNMNKLIQSAKMAVFQIGSQLAPVFTDLGESLRQSIGPVKEWIEQNGQWLRQSLRIAGVIAVVGVALIALGAVLSSVGTILGALIVTVKSLVVAFTFLAAHPVVAALVAITVVAIAAASAMGMLSLKTANLTTEMEGLRAKGDEVRATDKLRLQRLEQLAKVQDKNARQIKESAGLISTLTDRYGDLGISIDKTTGKITGMTNAQKKLSDAMRKAATLQVKAEMAEINLNQRRLHSAEVARKKGLGEAFGVSDDSDFKARTKVNQAQLAAAEARLEAIRTREEGSLTGGAVGATGRLRQAIAGGDASASESSGAVQARTEASDAAKRLAEIEEQAAAKTRTELQAQIHDIRTLTAERQSLIDKIIEGEKVREGGARAEQIDALRRQRAAVGAAAQDRIQAARFAESVRIAKEAQDAIDSQVQGRGVNKARLAERAGAAGDAVESSFSTVSTFRAGNLAQLGGGSFLSRSAKAAEDLATTMGEFVANADSGKYNITVNP
jgi:hypothetical protein